MFNSIVTHITEGSFYCGLEIAQIENGEIYRYLKLKKTKKELSIVECFELDSLEKVAEHVDGSSPLFLCIDTDSILPKQLEHAPSTENEALVNEAFPNLDTKNIFWELIQRSSYPIVSIARKDYIDSLLSKLKSYKIEPFEISLGLSSIESILPYIKEKEIRLAKCTLKLDEHSKVTISRDIKSSEPKTYNINGLSISNLYVLIFAQIVGHINQQERIGNLYTLNTVLTSTFKNQRFFHIISRSSLVFFVLILLINFFFYNHYFGKLADLDSIWGANSSKKEQLVQLDAMVKKKQKRVENYTLTSSSNITLYLDQFAQNVPESIVLDRINFQPLNKTIRKSKPIVLDRGIISVSGSSRDRNDFSKWMEQLATFDWIQNVETLDYDYLDKETSSFLLKIKYNEN